MNTSITLAQILGLYLTILGLAVLFRPSFFLQQSEGTMQNRPLLFFMTILGLIVGILIIVFHNVWVWGWPLIITILGWFVFLRSVIYLFFPKAVEKIMPPFQTTRAVYISSIIALILGLILLYFGFIHYR